MDLTLIDKIFPGGGVKEEDAEIAENIIQGIKHNDYNAFEKAGLMLNEKGRNDWGNHLINISHRIQDRLKKNGRL